MAKNLIPEIARMLGVKVGEKFKVKGDDELTYRFTSDGLKLTYNNNMEISGSAASAALIALLNGKDEIAKLPWKPKYKDKYWTFYINNYDKLDIDWNIWTEEVAELARLKAGWVYRTQEEAKSALPKVAAEFGVEYEL